ncbi:hypothetical protein [Blastococcus sp. SYSU DS0617]
MNRVLQAARLHLIHPAMMLGMPWLIVGISFALNLATWYVIASGDDESGVTGGVAALYVTVLIVFVQAVTQLLPFAMGVSLSRRAFYLGTALVACATALLSGVALSLLVSAENATGGWGRDIDFWAPGIFEVGNPVLQVFASAAPMLAFAFVGVGMGVVHQRWGQTGTWGLIIGTMLVFGGLALLITWLEAWRDVGEWFSDQSVVTLTVGLPLAVALIAALAALPGIRRVVP